MNKLKSLLSNKKIVIICLIVFIFMVAISLYFILFSTNNNKKVVVYVNSDSDLKYITESNDKPILISKMFTDSLNVKYNSNNTQFLYTKNSGLYLVSTGSNDSIKLDSEVTKFNFMKNGKVYYLTSDKELYLYDKSNKTKLDINVSDVVYNKNNLLVYIKDNNLYSYDVKKNNKKILLNTDSNISFAKINNNIDKIYYVINNEEENKKQLYLYDVDTKKSTTLSNNLYKVIDYNDDFSNIIYSEKKESKRLYELLLEDDLSSKDQSKVNTCDYLDVLQATEAFASYPENNYYLFYYIDGAYYYFLEVGGRQKATDELLNSCKSFSNSSDYNIRNEIRSKSEIIDFYDVYIYENDKTSLLESDVINLVDFSAKNKYLIATKYDTNKEKNKISTIKNIEEYDNIVNNIKYNLIYKQLEKEKNIISTSSDTVKKSMLRNDKIYYTLENNNKEVLYKYDIINDSNDKISDSVYLFDTQIDNYDISYLSNYNLETKTGDLTIVENGISKTIDTDIYTYLDVINGGNLYYYKDFNFEKLNGSFVIKNIKTEKEKIIDDVSLVEPISNEEFIILKDYSKSSNSFSLAKSKNSKINDIEYNVVQYSFSK